MGTMAANQLETHPRAASKMSELSGCIMEWDKNLRRCVQEGRTPPSDEAKRLALLRMLPTKQREKIWTNANQLYPTFPDLLSKVQELISDEFDAKQNGSQMDVDHVDDDDDEKGWVSTGETMTGTGQDGEEVIYMLQKRGNITRIKPKGGGRGSRFRNNRKPPGGGGGKASSKGSKWDPRGCARCGRSSHWAKECRATKGVNGNPPRDKPKGKGKWERY